MPHTLRVLLVAAPLVFAACGDRSGGGAASAEGADNSAAQADAAAKGPELAPPFTGKDLQGKDFDLAALRGKVVLLNVWASWCEPCKEELPTLADLYRERGHEGLVVVGVSIDAKRAEGMVRALVREHRVPYPVILDTQSTIVPKLKVSGYPTTVLIGRDGALRWRRDGLLERDDPELAGALKEALDEAAPG
ncbi:MAG: TlpA family protein disulfide reductase [Myxococcales bacterium]|nr:TlpA family protein disulfide reductase [Myxococcales bacterium]